jgi:triosephosphate isomerase (TIM)
MTMTERQQLVVGNWKMHGRAQQAAELGQAVCASVDDALMRQCVLLPPFVYLTQMIQLLQDSPIACGAQNMNEHNEGAYTGEIAADMLADIGCQYVLIGHSERRQQFGETNQTVATKYRQARKARLIPIVCVGETLHERQHGRTQAVIETQLDALLTDGVANLLPAVIAYEPVWAIGTGKAATPEEAQSVHQFIRRKIMRLNADIGQSLTILYGGSVKPGNAAEIFAMPDIDGGLIGGASLDAHAFVEILQCIK